MCTLCTSVDRVGRPGRSTDHLLVRAVDRAGRPLNLFCCCSAVLLLFPSSSFRRRLPRRSLDDPSTNHVNFLSNTSLFPIILHLSEDFFPKSEPNSNVPQSITWRNRHTILTKSTRDLDLRALDEIDTRSRLGICSSVVPGKYHTCLPCTSP